MYAVDVENVEPYADPDAFGDMSLGSNSIVLYDNLEATISSRWEIGNGTHLMEPLYPL